MSYMNMPLTQAGSIFFYVSIYLEGHAPIVMSKNMLNPGVGHEYFKETEESEAWVHL